MEGPMLIYYQRLFRLGKDLIFSLHFMIVVMMAVLMLAGCQSVDSSEGQMGGAGLWSSRFWQALRPMFQLSVPDMQAMRHALADYRTHKRTLMHTIKQAAPYLYYIRGRLHARSMPGELLLLPLVESDYHPFAYSLAGATGLWQMMPGTAMGYGVPIDWWYDGRRDVVVSTEAALDYLDHLYTLFDRDWILAVAAYDAGEGRVRRALRYNQAHGLPLSVSALPLPKETKHYVGRFLALKELVAHPWRYQITLPVVPNEPHFSPVEVAGQVTLQQVARMGNIPLEKLRSLNPGYRRLSTGPKGAHVFLLPIDRVTPFRQRMSAFKSGEVDEALWIKHEVVSGDTLSALAVKYHSRVRLIQRINQLQSTRLKPGQRLLIAQTEEGQGLPKRAKRQIAEDGLPGPHRIVYRVRRNDTLSVIAHRYGLDHHQIMFWNQIKRAKTLKAGDTLILWLRQKNSSPYATVHRGDTLSGLAKRYGVTVAWLKRRNHRTNDRIVSGESIIVR
jgi:membrane-bound lytic murein transglycosylase D